MAVFHGLPFVLSVIMMDLSFITCNDLKNSSLSFSKRSRSFREMRALSAFISSDSMRGTHLAQNFRNPRTPIMCPTLSLEISNATEFFFFYEDFRGSVLQRDLVEADHWQSQAFHFVFCHSNLLAPVLHL